MTLTIKFLGYPILTVQMETPPEGPTPVDKGIKAVSRFWTTRMTK